MANQIAKGCGLGCLGLVAIVFIGGIVGSHRTTTAKGSSPTVESATAAGGTQNLSSSPGSSTADAAPGSNWNYSSEEDQMTGRT
ncbi:MAG TPA: hypothetical protein VFH27_09425, partial [Longimicrobiaceae bacterium]|nr:hypothetical protein [Longimicrobiaceae bacterium]